MSLAARRYVGRFAPSPTGLLHAGSLAAALASWLDARAHAGRWLVRIEDVDRPRCIPGAAEQILRQLADCGLQPDAPPLWQSGRDGAYAEALARLRLAGWAYPCGCSRRDVALAQPSTRQRFGELIYPGTCRDGLNGKTPRAMRLRTERGGSAVIVDWFDRRLGPQRQNLATEVGDFVLQRADKLWAYQLAVVMDDAAQGVTDVVRGEDLADNTPRQILLQRALGLPTPRYLHTPLVRAADGEKLSKQHGAPPLAVEEPLPVLRSAARVLGLRVESAGSQADWLAAAVQAWRAAWITGE